MKKWFTLMLPILVSIAAIALYYLRDKTPAIIVLIFSFGFLAVAITWCLYNCLYLKVLSKNFGRKDDSQCNNMPHTNEWLAGFAKGITFFIRNYLSTSTIGPEENTFWEVIKNEKNLCDFVDNEEECYRNYMLNALFRGSDITEEEYRKLNRMIQDSSTKEILSRFIYSDETLKEAQINTNELSKQLDNDNID